MVGINGRAWFQPISSGPQSTLGARAFGVDSTQTASQCFSSAWLVEGPGSNHFSSTGPERLGFPRGPSGKEPICHCRRCRFSPWVGKIPWSRIWQPSPIFLPEKFHGPRSLVGYNPWTCKKSDTTELLTHTHTHRPELCKEGLGNCGESIEENYWHIGSGKASRRKRRDTSWVHCGSPTQRKLSPPFCLRPTAC